MTIETTTPQDEVNTSTSEPEAIEVPAWVREKPDDAYRQLVEARREAAANRVKAKELSETIEANKREAERAKLDEVGRLKAEVEDWRTKYTTMEQTVQVERKRAQLAPHVEHVDDALKLLDDNFLTPDGSVDVTKFLAAKPFLQRQQQRASVKNMNPPARSGGGMDDFIRSAVKGR